MKKLSEIGTEVWVHFSSPTMSGARSGLCHSHEPEGSSMYVKYTGMTIAERREFAERCFRAGLEAVLFAVMGAKFSTEGSCNKFLDENGL